jgi:AraC family transcriptional regulator, transcriptional activator of pobA
MKSVSITDFYNQINTEIPKELRKEIGHFNVFRIEDLIRNGNEQMEMPYDRRSYYKISLIRGKNKVEYADRTILINESALLFATPKIPYNYVSLESGQSGYFCVFTKDFFHKNRTGIDIDDLPIFNVDGYPVFEIHPSQAVDLTILFERIRLEIASDYKYKYELLRNLVGELIHFGQKLQPVSSLYSNHNSASRIAALFAELLERQFPIESIHQQIELKSARDFASRLSVHVNHLNRVLKKITGKTTTELIGNRLTTEAKILLKQTDWNISQIGNALGFAEVAHFSNFFKKQTSLTPLSFRS